MHSYTGPCRQNDDMSFTQSLNNRRQSNKSLDKTIIVQEYRTIDDLDRPNNSEVFDQLKLVIWQSYRNSEASPKSPEAKTINAWGGLR